MIPLGPVVARSRLRAARTAAWTYLADADRRAEWWPELRLDPRVGGDITERWSEEIEGELVSRDASGTVDVWVDGHAIGFTWREAGDFRDTAVLLTLRSQGQDTGITITETGFDALPDSADRAAASQDGWQVLLRDLTTAIEHAVAAGLLSAGPGTEDVVVATVAGAAVLHGSAVVAPAGEAAAGERSAAPTDAADAADAADPAGAADATDATDIDEAATAGAAGTAGAADTDEPGAADADEAYVSTESTPGEIDTEADADAEAEAEGEVDGAAADADAGAADAGAADAGAADAGAADTVAGDAGAADTAEVTPGDASEGNDDEADAERAATEDLATAEVPTVEDAAEPVEADAAGAEESDVQPVASTESTVDDTEDFAELDFDALIRGDGSDPDHRK
ncbi:activator of Hsp90 ATPase-like protein [Leucobacter luti]|uniref:SRPBCC family protein n=1 Tax=Leucobacter luti TaxID=340320 RepID=UPI00104DF499|nr:SRPBCC domain-containing protein [Leucobacter luti]MCW2288860.1 uncharacterized protein YndB with AHSA1/START domain [Leucobacter luti]TCK44989.1 activator of Hsp90 ATPase-like protein [Leucobacter luti]